MDEDECMVIASDRLGVSYPDTTPVGTIWIDTTTMNANVYTGYKGWTTITTNPCSKIIVSNVVFDDYMPSPKDLESMCKEYPALEKAYENFKTVYKMVEQDWNGKQKLDQQSLF